MTARWRAPSTRAPSTRAQWRVAAPGAARHAAWTAVGRRVAGAVLRAGPGSEGGPEAGTTLVELMISSVILLVVLAMTTVIVTVVSRQSATQLNQGRATEVAQVALGGVDQFLQGAVSPLAAYQAQKGDAANGTYPSSAAGLCWDENYPGPAPQSPLIANQNATGTATVVYAGSTAKAADPSTLSIIYAHDFDIELCSYPPNDTTPDVYEIYLDPSTCTSPTYGFCTVDVVKYTPTSTGACSSWANLYHQPTSGCATVVDRVANVWCDAGCQAAATQATGQTTYDSCWSYLPGSQVVPPQCAGISSATESSFTPPLFQYFGASSDTGTPINSAAVPFDLYCTPDSGACDPPVSTDDTANLVDAGIQSVKVDMTVLSGPGSTVTAHGARPGISVAAYLSLGNLRG